MPHSWWRRTVVVTLGATALTLTYAASAARAQVTITGRITDAATRLPIAGATVVVEGSALATIADTAARYQLTAVPAGPQMLRTTRLGYAPARVAIIVPTTGAITADIQLARNALQLHTITVTADPMSRARGELGTASVIEREAIRNQMATSLAGILELLPGIALAAPGLDGTQQIALRAVPVSTGGVSPLTGATAQLPSAQQLAAFGTQLVLDGMPQSNNTNLQSLGARGELTIPTSAGGGLDLRRIPAATIDRVEVIRGIPSARWGDLTQGVIVVDTRAGDFEPLLTARADANTREIALAGGRTLWRPGQTASITSDFARTIPAPGLRDDRTYRLTTGIAHRLALGGDAAEASDASARATFDSRVDLFRVFDDTYDEPPNPDVAWWSHDAGVHAVERARFRLADGTGLSITAGYEQVSQRSYSQEPLLRPAMPFTDRLTPGRSIGRYIGGSYVARVKVDGAPKHFYSRAELSRAFTALGGRHDVRAGTELRREWTSGAGYQFDVEFPPQVSFNGVQGFDRPRRYDAVPPLPTSALYLDDRLMRTLVGSATLQLQAGVRLDMLHRGGTWASGIRDRVLQPRVEAELAPVAWLRFRAGAGRMAKVPSLANLFPAQQYNDVVNVNWYANDPAERLAVLTTFIFDPTNQALGYSVADRAEAGVDVDLGRQDAQLSFVLYDDRLSRGVAIEPKLTYLLREHYQLTDSSSGTGKPPKIIEPASSRDTVPIVVDRPANSMRMTATGGEATLTLPEIPWLRTRLAMVGSLQRSRLTHDGIELASAFSNFQLSERATRAPYWMNTIRTGELALLTTRIIHHQPAIGLVVTGTIQHTLRKIDQDIGGTDTLAWSGYVTPSGQIVPVPASERGSLTYNDLHVSRTGLLVNPQRAPVDWVFSLQVSKSMPANGRLSFYAFNALDKVGKYPSATIAPLFYQPRRFGIELSMPIALGEGAR